MRRFKVITTSVGGHNNKIYYYDEEVLESNFPDGNADKLVSGGYLKEILDQPTSPVGEVPATEPNSNAGTSHETDQNSSTEKGNENPDGVNDHVDKNPGEADQKSKEGQNKKGPGKK